MDPATLMLLFAGYLAPGLLAVVFRHRRGWLVLIVNALIGWTVLGWFFAWGMALSPLSWRTQVLGELDELRAELTDRQRQ